MNPYYEDDRFAIRTWHEILMDPYYEEDRLAIRKKMTLGNMNHSKPPVIYLDDFKDPPVNRKLDELLKDHQLLKIVEDRFAYRKKMQKAAACGVMPSRLENTEDCKKLRVKNGGRSKSLRKDPRIPTYLGRFMSGVYKVLKAKRIKKKVASFERTRAEDCDSERGEPSV